MSNAERIRAAFEAARNGDRTPAESLLDPHVEWYAAEAGVEPCRSRDDVLRVWSSWPGPFPIVERIEEAGDRVAVESAAADQRFVSVFRMRDGRIVHMQDRPSFDDALADLRG